MAKPKLLSVFEDRNFIEAFDAVDDSCWEDGDGEGLAPRIDPTEVSMMIGSHIEFGDYAETYVMFAGRTHDGRYFFLNSSCDTTGWECQANGHAYVSKDLERVKTFGMTLNERIELLGISD